MDQLTTPVLFIVFARPDTTRQVFEAIRKAKPKYLYVSADAPREGNKEELERSNQVKAIIDTVDWDCELKTKYETKNQGPGLGPKGAIDWFFENVEEGIILEDDCLPSQSFFPFCSELLEKYRDNEKVMHVAGMNYLEDEKYVDSYRFCLIGGIWGWATWRRAWNKYEHAMDSFLQNKASLVFDRIFGRRHDLAFYYENLFTNVYHSADKENLWDYQWTYIKLLNESINIMPAKNMVVNIGFGDYGARCTVDDPRFSNLKALEIAWPLQHPKKIKCDLKFSYAVADYVRNKIPENRSRLYLFFRYIYRLVKLVLSFGGET